MSSSNRKASILNMGCGKTRIPHSLGVDVVEIPGFTDVVMDFNAVPYPFETNSVEEIHLYHVLEHLDHPLLVLEELHRILKPSGILHIRVPHFSSLAAFTDITHKRPFAYLSFDVLNASHPQHYYTKASFIVLNKEIKYFGLYPNTGVYADYIHANECPMLLRPLVTSINFLIKLSPVFFERIWCYWVGGAGELVVDLKKA